MSREQALVQVEAVASILQMLAGVEGDCAALPGALLWLGGRLEEAAGVLGCRGAP